MINEGFLSFTPGELAAGKSGPLQLPEFGRFLALERPGLYWMQPFVGSGEAAVPPETQFLLWERAGGNYGLLIPLIDGDLRATVQGGPDGLSLVWEGALEGTLPDTATLAFVALGDEPAELVRASMAAIQKRLGTFRLREDKARLPFLDWLGWCSWDAFYHEVDEAKMLAALESFQAGPVQPGFVMLDDGWLDVEGEFLNGFEALPAKFPGGLRALVERAKRDFGVKLFGVWHAFPGYWGGVNPMGPLAKNYRLLPAAGLIRPWDEEQKPVQLSMVVPEDAARFYDDFYAFLAAQGVDLVKVDGQASLEVFTAEKLGRVGTAATYQRAMQGAAAKYFDGQLLHCMCNVSDIAFNLQKTSAWRNSDDYFPKRPDAAQQTHIYVNALNSLWTSTFAVPDWDMFQTHGPAAEFHAIGRAISGGPVYICDQPGLQDFDLLHRLCLGDGRALRPDRPALPATECLFVDARTAPHLLKIHNVSGAVGLLGLFHCQHDGEAIAGSFGPADVPEFRLGPDTDFAVYCHRSRELETLNLGQSAGLTLNAMEAEMVIVAPIRFGLAALGLLDKLCSPAVMETCTWDPSGTVTIGLKEGGLAGFYAATRPAGCLVNGQVASADYQAGGLLKIEVPAGGPATVVIRLRE